MPWPMIIRPKTIHHHKSPWGYTYWECNFDLLVFCRCSINQSFKTPKWYCRWSDLLKKGQDAQKREGEERERESCVCKLSTRPTYVTQVREVCKFLHSTVKCVFVMNTPTKFWCYIIGWIHWFPYQLCFGRCYVYSAPLQGNGQSTSRTLPFYTCSHKEHH